SCKRLLNHNRRNHKRKAKKKVNRKFNCEVCSYTCAARGALEIHICMHTGERPHKCTIGDCSNGFVSRGHLLIHQRVLHKVKPFYCSD
ncbi:hypothetical protein PENTCL1PPCAC_12466, partial [Pristionchus entomophagus]